MLLKTRANFEMNFLDLTVVRFLCLLLFVYVWTANIGHPDVFLQEKEKSPRKDEGDEITGERQANSSFVDMYQELMREIDSLAKPLGSLGTLGACVCLFPLFLTILTFHSSLFLSEDWAARLGALQGTSRPKVKSPVCIVYAGDHGAAKSIADGGASCSAYPQEVTRYILKALRIGLAGASVLAGEVGVDVKVVDVGVVGECSDVSSPFKLKDGTRNFLLERAMTTEEVQKLLQVGRGAVKDCIALGHDCLALGEVGIGNTTASSLLLCTILSCPPEKCVDGGARKSKKVDEEKIKHKIALIKKALRKHARLLKSCPRGEDLLECFGGAEITALVGSFLEASDRKVPVLVDGFIVSIAALVAATISPCVTQCLFFGKSFLPQTFFFFFFLPLSLFFFSFTRNEVCRKGTPAVCSSHPGSGKDSQAPTTTGTCIVNGTPARRRDWCHSRFSNSSQRLQHVQNGETRCATRQQSVT